MKSNKRNNRSMFYGSSYDRGLEHLLKMWPKIIKAVPDAELFCCYGWDLFAKFYADNPERMAWKDSMDKLMTQKGITHLGRISHGALRDLIERAGIFAYPTHFGETSCCVGDTPILMPRDHQEHPYGIPIKELVGKSNFHVYSFDHEDHKITLGRVKWVKKTRKNAKLLRITLDDGSVLRFTPDHKFMLRDGSYKRADKMEVGESLMPCYEKPSFAIRQIGGKWEDEHRMIAEAVYGGIKGKIVDHINGNRYDNTPGNLRLMTPSEHSSKIANEERLITDHYRKKMSIAQKKLAETPERKKFFSKLGTLRANKFWDIYRSWPIEKQKAWAKARAEKRNHSIINIREDNVREDVYDMEVEKYHNFAAGGVFVHNCITAMKCQAWGAIPVVINYAGIRETVKFGVKVEGDIYDQETKDDYVKQLVALLKDDKRQEKIRKEMIPWALENFTWESVAKQWTEEFKKPPSLEKQLETLLDHNQALKAYELSKGTEFEKKIYPLVEHVFDPEVYKKYYNNELLEIPVSDEIAYDCTKLAPRFEWLVKEITNKMPKEVLDIGCADGYLCLTLASKGVKCKGINLYKPSIEVAEKRAEKKHLPASFAWMDFHKENGQYEAIVMFEVLEHLPEPQKAIEKAYSLLKEGGSLYLSTPRTDHKGVEEHIKNKYANPDRIKPWDDPRPSGHLRLWTEEEFRELLKDYNVKQFIVNQDREMLVEIVK